VLWRAKLSDLVSSGEKKKIGLGIIEYLRKADWGEESAKFFFSLGDLITIDSGQGDECDQAYGNHFVPS